jgi:peroxiredoxin
MKTGPNVGTKLPDFRAQDQTGAWRTLSALLGPKGLMLVIIRSADW